MQRVFVHRSPSFRFDHMTAFPTFWVHAKRSTSVVVHDVGKRRSATAFSGCQIFTVKIRKNCRRSLIEIFLFRSESSRSVVCIPAYACTASPAKAPSFRQSFQQPSKCDSRDISRHHPYLWIKTRWRMYVRDQYGDRVPRENDAFPLRVLCR